MNYSIIGSDNGLSPDWCQAIIWTNDGVLLIGPLGTNFSEIFYEIHIFPFKEMHLKMLSGKWRPFCLGLNVLVFPLCVFRPNCWQLVLRALNHVSVYYICADNPDKFQVWYKGQFCYALIYCIHQNVNVFGFCWVYVSAIAASLSFYQVGSTWFISERSNKNHFLVYYWVWE